MNCQMYSLAWAAHWRHSVVRLSELGKYTCWECICRGHGLYLMLQHCLSFYSTIRTEAPIYHSDSQLSQKKSIIYNSWLGLQLCTMCNWSCVFSVWNIEYIYLFLLQFGLLFKAEESFLHFLLEKVYVHIHHMPCQTNS